MALAVLYAPLPLSATSCLPELPAFPERRRVQSLAEKYEKLAASHGLLFADSGKWNIELAFDGVHFTEKGHADFAENLEAILKMI